jgi:selenocysteine-specific elongation factor
VRVVATAGHVDHGKSTLLRALTGMEPDRWDEEQRRGLTIDLGFVWVALPTPAGAPETIAFVDVPGHERFIPNMLAGVGAVRFALFVVAADDGWSAQSQEHLDILDLLDVPAAVVAITKTGTVPPARSRQVADDVTRRLTGTTLEGAPVLLVDGIDRTGLDELRAALADRLAHTLAPTDRGRPRLWVDRSFSITGAGTVVTGTLEGGTLGVGQEVAVLQSGRLVRVRGVQMLGEAAERAGPGSRVALNLAGIDRDEVGRGDVVVGLHGRSGRAIVDGWRATSEVDAWVRALPGAEIDRRGAWHLHAGSAETTVRLYPLLNEPIVPGAPGHVRLRLEHPLVLISGDRFVLREAGRAATVGGGEVLDPDPPAVVRGPDARLERVEQLDQLHGVPGGASRLRTLVAAADGARRAGRAHAAAGTDPAAELPDGLTSVGDWVATSEALAHWTTAVRDATASHHRTVPDGAGPSRGALGRAARAAGAPAEVADSLPDELVQRGILEQVGSAFSLPEHAATAARARATRETALLAALQADPFSPPPLEEVAREIGMGHEEVNHLVQTGRVVRCGPVAFAAETVTVAVERLRQLEAEEGRFTTAQARELLGTSRKYIIPLLEHLDAVGVTGFDGSTRQVRDGSTRQAPG